MKKIEIIIFPVIMLLFTACARNKDQHKADFKENMETIPVKIIGIEKKSIIPEIKAYGIIKTQEDVKMSFNMNGRIKRMYARQGEYVRKGQLLAELELTELMAQVDQATESYNKAVRDFKRLQNLRTDSAATLEQIQNAETTMNIARESLKILAYNKAYTVIKAPENGVVLQKMNNEGEFVNAGSPVYMVSSEKNNEFIIKVSLTANERLLVAVGDYAEIELEGKLNNKFKGKVKHIAHNADYSTGLYTVDIQINQNSESISVGLFATVNIIPERSIAYYTLPLECLIEGNNKKGFVYVPKENKRVEKVELDIDFIDKGLFYFKKKPEYINTVIKEGAGFLSSGSRVSINQ
ncbi:efflux RND transporter periplasmic adaptor subunit [Apibacter raozihei]|uniref:efflux RND transporter periplasmic adaptor subunit n=1 Tax=Apibacter raozihei TaxID=2500547 RepID=UPI000FE42A0C|nr:efflux RND transporter periplasmic adaptor subunit [Apibacter raozihei]